MLQLKFSILTSSATPDFESACIAQFSQVVLLRRRLCQIQIQGGLLVKIRNFN